MITAQEELEIERIHLRKMTTERDELLSDTRRLQESLRKCAEHVGAVISPGCSTEFHCSAEGEVNAAVSKLKAAIERLRGGPAPSPAPVTVSEEMAERVAFAFCQACLHVPSWSKLNEDDRKHVVNEMRAALEAYEASRGVDDGWVANKEIAALAKVWEMESKLKAAIERLRGGPAPSPAPVTAGPGILERLEGVLWEARSAYAGQFDVADILHHVVHGKGKYEPAPVTVSDEMVERAAVAYDDQARDCVSARTQMRAALEAYESARGGPAPSPATVSKERVFAALDLYAAQMEKWGLATTAMRAALEAYEASRGVDDGWVAIGGELPEVYQDRYYGKDFSVPVMLTVCRNKLFRWYFPTGGWVEAGWSDGWRPSDYEDWGLGKATHWRPLPPPPIRKEPGGT